MTRPFIHFTALALILSVIGLGAAISRAADVFSDQARENQEAFSGFRSAHQEALR